MCSLKIQDGAFASACTLCVLETNYYDISLLSKCLESPEQNNKLAITCKFKRNNIIFCKKNTHVKQELCSEFT